MVFDITCYYWTMKTPWFPSPSTQVWYKVMIGSQSQLLDKLSRALHTSLLGLLQAQACHSSSSHWIVFLFFLTASFLHQVPWYWPYLLPETLLLLTSGLDLPYRSFVWDAIISTRKLPVSPSCIQLSTWISHLIQNMLFLSHFTCENMWLRFVDFMFNLVWTLLSWGMNISI